MAKNSQSESDGLVWQTVGLPLGERGMDARRPSDPETLVDALNAKFLDAKTIARRNGHDGYKVQDREVFLADLTVTSAWYYGHGLLAYDESDPAEVQDTHYPLAGRARGVFESGGKSVVWTGDRLIMDEQHGSHAMWGNKGFPAYLPVQDDKPFSLAGGNHVDTCLTNVYEVTVVTRGPSGVEYCFKSRENGNVLFSGTFGFYLVSQVRVINSGGFLLLFVLDASGLSVAKWSGTAWVDTSLIEESATAFDVSPSPNGCEVIWDDTSGIDHKIRLGGFTGDQAGLNHVWGRQPFIGTTEPSTNLKLAVAVAPNGDIAYAWTSDHDGAEDAEDQKGLFCHSDNSSLEYQDTTGVTALASVNLGWLQSGGHVAITYRNIQGERGKFDYTVYGTHTPHALYNDSSDYTTVWRVTQADESAAGVLLTTKVIFTATLLSKAFTVGNEVFAWLHSRNSETAFLIGNDYVPQVCGIADREVVVLKGTIPTLRSVQKDPLSDTKFVWSRPYNAGKYFRRGDINIGYLDFLPKLSTANFGKGVYLAGSHVRCWDGVELGDAGFHDYPSIKSALPTSGGSVDSGEHFIRVYPVRYTNQGERFQGAAVTSSGVTVTSGRISLDLRTVPVTNHDDVVLEVYMTPVGSTVFRYVGAYPNNKNDFVVSLDITISDTDLESNPADPHAPGTDGLQEMEEFGPTGCAVLEVSGDRLWGIGGQVPTGCAQFSKLYEVGEGVGFGDLINTQIFDATGQPLTSIKSFSDSAVVAFQRNRFYSLLGPGPNNFGEGEFSVPELKIASGAISHWGTITTPVGVLFWSPEGPRALAGNFQVMFIGEGVAPLAAGMTPSGVRFELDTNEVIWYTEDGNALLYNFGGKVGRFARWTGVPAAGVSDNFLATPDGECWTPSSSTPRDYGRSFVFAVETGNVRLENLLQGGIRIRRVGLTGKWLGEHKPKFRLYYDGSPDWLERIIWEPGAGSYLVPVSQWANLTPAQIDALGVVDKTGRYDNMMRVARQDCAYVRLKLSDSGNAGFIPWELTFEIASKGGATRLAAQTITRNGA